MNSQQRIDVALRSALIAKSILNITNTNSAITASIMLSETIKTIQALSKQLKDYHEMEEKQP